MFASEALGREFSCGLKSFSCLYPWDSGGLDCHFLRSGTDRLRCCFWTVDECVELVGIDDVGWGVVAGSRCHLVLVLVVVIDEKGKVRVLVMKEDR